jgi:Protein of unknown function (DUF3014)
MAQRSSGLGWIVAVIALGVAAGWWWLHQQQAQTEPTLVPPNEATSAGNVASEPQPTLTAEPAIQHPIDAVVADDPRLDAGPSDPGKAITAALMKLAGRKGVLEYMLTDDFIHRVVVTTDNLARSHAASRLWPVVQTPQRFLTANGPGETRLIAPANDARYTGFVDFVTGVNARGAVGLYKRLYPEFQKSYESLGYPGKYFNDRVVEVIDHLLATPDPAPPVAVAMTEVKGPYAVQRPWVHYGYVDADLQARSSGQKMMMRMGRDNAARLKTKLREFRALLAGPGKG